MTGVSASACMRHRAWTGHRLPPPAVLQTRTVRRDGGHGVSRAGNSTGIIEGAVHTTTTTAPPTARGGDGDGDVVLATAPFAGASPRDEAPTPPRALLFLPFTPATCWLVAAPVPGSEQLAC